MSHKAALRHLDKIAASIPEASEVIAPLGAALASDEVLMSGTPTVAERAASSKAICDALSGVLGAFLAADIALPNENEGDELVRIVGRVLSS